MAEKTFEFKFSIGAVMMGNFSATFGSANKELSKLDSQINKNEKQINKLTKAQAMNSAATAQNAKEVSELTQANAELEKRRNSLLGQESKLAGTFGKAAMAFGTAQGFAGAANSLFNLTQYAIKFESSMADVRKVVDFETPEQFKAMSKDVLDLSTKIPMAATGLAQIVAAGGQSGIARNELLGFAESAAKMGVAFDITADQAGDMMAKWRTAFKMNQSEVVELADKINLLGNTTAASAPLISDVVTRIGPLGEVGGVASGEIAALGASLVGSGINSEIAATGIKNLILALVSGESATKSQNEAFSELGFNAVDMAKAMQKDARGAILSVLEAVQRLDKEQQASVLQSLFGKESLGAIAPLLSNLDALKVNFDAVADSSKYAGSMEAEFAAIADTSENSLILMNNRMDAAKTSIAQGLLPVVTPLAEGIGQLAILAGNLAGACPPLTKAVMIGTAAFIAFGAAGSFARTIFYGGKWLIQGAKALNMFSGAAKIATAFTRGFALAQLAFNTVLAACPVGWLIAGVAGLIVAGTALYRNWDKVKSFFSTMWDNPIVKLMLFASGPVGWLIAVPTYVIAHWDELAAYLNYFWDNPRAALFRFTSWVKEELTGAVKWVEEKWEGIRSFLSTPIFGSVNITAAGKGQKVAQNAYGGIYSKGAFLTSFAERDGESAIPHTPNKRNVGLLAATNAIMGNPLGVIEGNGKDNNNREKGLNAAVNAPLALKAFEFAQPKEPKVNKLNEINNKLLSRENGNININATFAPQITVQGGGSDTAAQIDTLMTQKLREFEEMLKRVAAQQRRLSYA